ncbi:MAG: hypothetical protein U0517_02785 [Candidatus Andersenbacteria bacterium]
MAEITSREKVVYWILILVVAVGGGAALAYFFVSGQQNGTSLADVATQTTPGAVQTQSLVDIVSNSSGGSGSNAVSTTPVATTPTTQTPSANVTPVSTPVSSQPQTNSVNTPVSVNPAPVNQLLQAGNTPNDFLNRPSVTSASSTSLSSGSALPGSSPTTGAEVLVLSGIASLGVSGLAASMVLRKPGRRSRKSA